MFLGSIISVSRLSLMLCFPTNSSFAMLVAKIDMSVLMQLSVANPFFGDGNLTGSSSRRKYVFPANQLTAPSEAFQNYHLFIICTNPGMLVICWIDKCIADDLQWL